MASFVKVNMVLFIAYNVVMALVVIYLISTERKYQCVNSRLKGKHHMSPTIFAVTTTRRSMEQRAELTRISHTLRLVPNVHWLVVEDAMHERESLTTFLNDTKLSFTYITTKSDSSLYTYLGQFSWAKGSRQRNRALGWIRLNVEHNFIQEGVVYFMDEGNSYSYRLFDEIRKVKTVGVWPVGLAGGMLVERPLLDRTGKKVIGFSRERKDMDMPMHRAGYAIHTSVVHANPEAVFMDLIEADAIDSNFLSQLVKMEDLQPLADRCSKVYVWATETQTP